MNITISVHGCASCPFERNFSGSEACVHPGGPLPGTIDADRRTQGRMPWCPLDNDPAMVRVRPSSGALEVKGQY